MCLWLADDQPAAVTWATGRLYSLKNNEKGQAGPTSLQLFDPARDRACIKDTSPAPPPSPAPSQLS